MQAVDLQGNFGDYLLDEKRKIPKAHQDAVCKLRQGKAACRYVALGPKGFICAKHTPMKAELDRLVDEDNFTARGDNCDGFGEIQ